MDATKIFRDYFSAASRSPPSSGSSPAPREQAWAMRVAAPDEPGRGALRRVSSNPAAALTLQRIAAQAFFPDALGADDAVAAWAERNPGELTPPRTVGRSDHPDGRRLRPTDAWLAARLRALLGPVEQIEDAETYRLLKALGLLSLREFEPRRRIVRRHHRLELDMADARDPGADARSSSAIREMRHRLRDSEREAAEAGELAGVVSG